jgi:hypothetical protein
VQLSWLLIWLKYGGRTSAGQNRAGERSNGPAGLRLPGWDSCAASVVLVPLLVITVPRLSFCDSHAGTQV